LILAGLLLAAKTAGIDHIILGVPNLDEGMRAFETRTGVKPLRGGRHPLRGTENALVSLGGGVYLEIIAPQPEAKANEMVTALRALKRPTLVGWAVHVPEEKDAAAKLASAGFKVSAPMPGSRVRRGEAARRRGAVLHPLGRGDGASVAHLAGRLHDDVVRHRRSRRRRAVEAPRRARRQGRSEEGEGAADAPRTSLRQARRLVR
jgi:hypothetical protein